MNHSGNPLDCKKLERELEQTLNALADEFDDVQSKLDKAKVSFASTGAAGGILTIVGLALTPITFGASLGLSIAGGVIGGLSAAGSIGSLIADKVISSKTMKKAQTKLEEYFQAIKSIEEELPQLLALLDNNQTGQLESIIQSSSKLEEVTKLYFLEAIHLHQFWELLNDTQKGKLKNIIKRSSKLDEETKQVFLKAIKIYEDKLGFAIKFVIQVRSALTPTCDVVKNLVNLALFINKGSSAGKVLSGMGAGAGATANAANAGRAIGTGKVVGAGVGLASDLGAIVYLSVKIHKKKPSEIAEKIREVASCFQ